MILRGLPLMKSLGDVRVELRRTAFHWDRRMEEEEEGEDPLRTRLTVEKKAI